MKEVETAPPVSQESARTSSSSNSTASPLLSALAAVLHYLAAFSQAVRLQQGDLRPVAERITASGLYGSGMVADTGPANVTASNSPTSMASGAEPSSASPAADRSSVLHPLVSYALACITPHSAEGPSGHSGQLVAPQTSTSTQETAQLLLPANDATPRLAACVELLDGLIALRSTLSVHELAVILPRAVSVAVGPQASHVSYHAACRAILGSRSVPSVLLLHMLRQVKSLARAACHKAMFGSAAMTGPCVVIAVHSTQCTACSSRSNA